MLDIRRVLCPVDFSDASHHALDHAVMIAGWYRARLTALHKLAEKGIGELRELQKKALAT